MNTPLQSDIWLQSYEGFDNTKNNIKQRNLNPVFANISKTTSPTSDSFLLIMSHITLWSCLTIFLLYIVFPTDHPYFVGVQYHPEYLTRPMKPSPPYLGLILASINRLQSYITRGCRLSPRSSFSDVESSDTEEEMAISLLDNSDVPSISSSSPQAAGGMKA